jgi:hypothetical protein
LQRAINSCSLTWASSFNLTGATISPHLESGVQGVVRGIHSSDIEPDNALTRSLDERGIEVRPTLLLDLRGTVSELRLRLDTALGKASVRRDNRVVTAVESERSHRLECAKETLRQLGKVTFSVL